MAQPLFPSSRPYQISQLVDCVQTSTPRDRTASVLKERVKKYLEGLDGFGASVRVRSDSTLRAFVSPYYTGERDRVRVFMEVMVKMGESNEYPNRSWEDVVASDYVRASLQTELEGFGLLLGRESLKWGPSPFSPLLLSGSSPPFDMAYAHYRGHRFQVSTFFTALDARGDTSRYLTGHRVECMPLSGLFLGMSEIVLHGGHRAFPDLYYLNPLVVFYPREWNVGRPKANILWAMDASYFGHGWGAYGELMIDDYPYEATEKNEAPKLGLVLGVRVVDLLRSGEYVVLEYARVNRWCYGHTLAWQRYAYLGYSIGHPLGNDFDRVLLSATEHVCDFLDLEVSAHYTRKGEGRTDDPYPEGEFPDDYFLSGVVEERRGAGLGARYVTGSLWTVELGGGWDTMRDYRHVSGNSHSQPFIYLRLEKLFE